MKHAEIRNVARTVMAAALCGFVEASAARAADGDWIPLFDGRSLAGWTARCTPADTNKVFWKVEDGAILCDSTGRKDHDYVWLVSERAFADFELELKFQVFRGVPGNSGVQVRSRYDTAPGTPRGGWLDGPQIDIHPPTPWRTGFIYDETRGTQRWIHPSLKSSAIRREEVTLPENWTFRYADEGDGWNDLRIVCRGTRITTELNGAVISDYDGRGVLDDEAHRARRVGLDGHLALQLHTRDEMKIRFRGLRVRGL